LSYYIGLLSGTSVDGIDVALFDIDESQIKIVETIEKAFSIELKQQIQSLIKSQTIQLRDYSKLDCQIATEFSIAVNLLLNKAQINAKDVTAVGSHGQTIFHQPTGNYKNTIQLGNPHLIAAQTGINVVSNFRNLDMALDGQGAPLAPIIHEKLFKQDNKNIALLNLGGIANISFIGKDFAKIIGFDTGPANCLMDEWISIHKRQAFDKDGAWAGSGKLNKQLLQQMLADPYFQKKAPKSTGREYFNINWFENFKEQFQQTSAVDIQTTLAHLVAASVAESIKTQSYVIDEIIVMGGGAYNSTLISLINKYSNINTLTSNSYGYDVNWIEATLFAYLAYLRVNLKPLNLNSITGSRSQLLVGDLIKIKY
jgi:anhydro-N-acetylmuramic acid kinase